MSKWKSMPAAWPVDGSTVWLRAYWQWEVFAGTWVESEGVFEGVKQWDPKRGWLQSNQSIVWFIVVRWKEIDSEPVVL